MASRAFKDINLSFKRHPVTNDVVTIRDEDAIKRSVKNIIFTILGEKPFLPLFGSVINESLFDLNTNLNEIRISLKLVFKSNKDSLITEPKKGSNGFSPRIVKIMFFTDLLIASSLRIVTTSFVTG